MVGNAAKKLAANDDGRIRAVCAVEVLRRSAAEGGDEGEAAKKDEATRSIRVVASTATPDRNGRVVVQDWILDAFSKNPVVFFNHGMGSGMFGEGTTLQHELPIGRASDVEVKDDKLYATIHFLDEKANPLAPMVYEQVKQGGLSAVSVGWIPGEVDYDEKADLVILRKNELLEISVVSLPANPDAVIEGARLVAALRARAKGGAPAASPAHDELVAALAAALGLDAAASETELLAAAETIAGDRRALLEALGASSRAEAEGAVIALREQLEQLVAAKEQLAEFQATTRDREVAQIVREAEAAGKLTAANKETFLPLCGGDPVTGKGADPAKLRGVVAQLKPVLTPKGATAPKAARVGSSDDAAIGLLTDRQRRICRENGWDEQRFAQRLARVRSHEGGARHRVTNDDKED